MLTVVDSVHGYRSLAKIPPRDEIEAFYRVTYPYLVETKQRIVNKPDTWLRSTVWADIKHALDSHVLKTNKMVLDVGAGDGELVDELTRCGWDAQGCDLAWENGQSFHSLAAMSRMLRNISLDPENGGIDAILMCHYLAHDPDPVAAVQGAWDMLRPGGILFVRTGNDFNPLQIEASKTHGMYWVNAPDIIHYFSQKSLQSLLKANGFRIVDAWNDFPIEALLLDGLDYVNDRQDGELAHSMRQSAELAMPPYTRRAVNRANAHIGIGRCAHVVARKV
jgi:2-polyprenyl-3-methyl-5-hydroxy-6-metoxy-1,4-benzoquinol methylase